MSASVLTPAAAVPAVRFKDPQIEMAHGAGGKASRRLIDGLFAPLLVGAAAPLGDAAHLQINGARIAMTADSFVVRPLRFPGGSIGGLAVHGTVNDLAVSGARAEALVTTYVLEAGLPTPVLEAEVRAMAEAARRCHVTITGGDTKVVEHGRADGMYITTMGVGTPMPGVTIDPRSVRVGDQVLLSGCIGDHGVTILLARGDLDLEADLCSDSRSVLPLVESLVAVAARGVRWMRDPTRGGVATALNELARDCGLSVHLFEQAVPVRDSVRGACELLGLDPLHIANEGQFLAVVAPEMAEAALDAIRRTPGGNDARLIGEVRDQPARAVLATTRYGGSRIVDMLVGDPLPENLLRQMRSDVKTISRLAALVEDGFAERNALCERFFAREADRLAAACGQMSERFLQGGRLLAFGRGPCATDAQHVSVEFVHPVIVGKRALPALDLSLDFPQWVKAIVRPEDMVMGFGPPDGDPDVRDVLDAAGARGAMTFALPGPHGSYAVRGMSDHPFIHQEIVEILYHVLWETVHVFFERRELGHDVGAAGFLYPFLGRQKQDMAAAMVEVADSIRMKAGDDSSLRRRIAEEQTDALVEAARAIRTRLERGGKLILFGNGGSATDANDWALDCVAPPAGYRPIPAVSLSMESAIATAIANDVGADVIFLRQLIAHATPDDVAIAISTSGGSRNVVMALEEARRRGLLTVALLGYDGGEVLRRGLADVPLVVASDYIPRIQEVQASMYHIIRELNDALDHD